MEFDWKMEKNLKWLKNEDVFPVSFNRKEKFALEWGEGDFGVSLCWVEG